MQTGCSELWMWLREPCLHLITSTLISVLLTTKKTGSCWAAKYSRGMDNHFQLKRLSIPHVVRVTAQMKRLSIPLKYFAASRIQLSSLPTSPKAHLPKQSRATSRACSALFVTSFQRQVLQRQVMSSTVHPVWMVTQHHLYYFSVPYLFLTLREV